MQARRRRLRSAKPFKGSILIALLIVSVVLNWLWEMAQMPAYVETAGRSWRETALSCAVFSVGDAVLVLMIYGAGVAIASRIANLSGVKFYTLLSALGIFVAVLVELTAKATGSWTYSERMPVFLGLGMLPILQLATLGPAAVWLASTWSNRQ